VDVNLGLVEYPQRELLHQLLDVAGPDVIDLVSVLKADDCLVGLVFVLYPLYDVLSDHAVQRSLVNMLLAVERLLRGKVG
jgi:hypothetical protein